MLLFSGVITTFRPEWAFVLRKTLPSGRNLPFCSACVLIFAPISPNSLLRPSAGDPRANAFHQLLDFVERGHGSISGCGHRQSSMRGATFDRPRRLLAGEDP